MKTPTLMAAIVAGLTLVAVDAQAQEQGRPDFATLDTDGNGSISQAELQAQGAARFATADTDGDGALSEAELLAQAAARSEGRATQMVARMLEHRDTNENGVLEQAELTPDADRAAKRFARVDANDDGELSEDEFQNARPERGERRGGRHGGGDRGPRPDNG